MADVHGVEMKVTLDIEYGPAGERNRLDIFRPAGHKKPLPVVLCVHGGGWCGGCKEGWTTSALLMARHGFACVAINYRLAPAHTCPAAQDDVALAAQWVVTHAKNLGIDPARMAAIGDSAGGHLSSMLALAPPRRIALRCVVDMFGPVDFCAMMDTESRPLVAGYVAQPYPEAKAAYEAASPIKYVHKNAPPFLILHGTEDKGQFHGSVPIAISRAFHKALQAAGNEATLIEIEGAGHGFGGEHQRQMWEATMP